MKANLFILFSCFVFGVSAQEKQYDLTLLLKNHKPGNFSAQGLKLTAGSDKKAISAGGITWIKGSAFSEGVIEVDLRGKNVFQKSFPGIVFSCYRYHPF